MKPTEEKIKIRPVKYSRAEEYIIPREALGTFPKTVMESVAGIYQDKIIIMECYGKTGRGDKEVFGEKWRMRGLTLVRGATRKGQPFDNLQSWFITRANQWVHKTYGTRWVKAYADPEFGEFGQVYKASNWNFYGFSDSGKLKFFQPLGNKKKKREIMEYCQVPILPYPSRKNYQHLDPPEEIPREK